MTERVRLIGEIQAADRAGFTRWRDFQRARRLGRFPKPDLTEPDRWSETTLERWIDGTPTGPDIAVESSRLIERLERGTSPR